MVGETLNNALDFYGTNISSSFFVKWAPTVTGEVSCCKCFVSVSLSADLRIRPMILVVKKWARHGQINDASKGTLSSYTLVLMVLHYLQSKYNPTHTRNQFSRPICTLRLLCISSGMCCPYSCQGTCPSLSAEGLPCRCLRCFCDSILLLAG